MVDAEVDEARAHLVAVVDAPGDGYCLPMTGSGSSGVDDALCRVDALATAVESSLSDVAADAAIRLTAIMSEFNRVDAGLAGAL